MNAKPIPVRWVRNDELDCCMYAMMGLSTKCIMERTGLSHSQVTYRLNKAQVKRKEYRDGTSDFAQLVMQRMMPSRNRDKVSIIGVIPIMLKVKGDK